MITERLLLNAWSPDSSEHSLSIQWWFRYVSGDLKEIIYPVKFQASVIVQCIYYSMYVFPVRFPCFEFQAKSYLNLPFWKKISTYYNFSIKLVNRIFFDQHMKNPEINTTENLKDMMNVGEERLPLTIHKTLHFRTNAF